MCFSCVGVKTTTLVAPVTSQKRKRDIEAATEDIRAGKKKKARRGGAAWRNELKAKKSNKTDESAEPNISST